MRHDNRLSATQRKFLRSMRNDAAALPEVIAKLQLKPMRVTRWFRHPVFRQTLADVLREVRRLGDAELELGARLAKRMVSQMLAEKIKLDRLMLMACFGVIEAHERMRSHRKRPARAKRAPEQPKRPKHPGHSDEVGKKMLDELFERHEAAKRAPGDAAKAHADAEKEPDPV